MAILGRPPASAPLNSSDIPAGSVSAVKVASDVATQAELDAQKTNSSVTTLGTVTAGNLAAGVTGGSGLATNARILLNETNISSSIASVEFIHGTGGVDFSSTYTGYLVILSMLRGVSAGSISIKVGKSSGYESAYRVSNNRNWSTGSNYNSGTDQGTGAIWWTQSHIPANDAHINEMFAHIYFSNLSTNGRTTANGTFAMPDGSTHQGSSSGVTQNADAYDRLKVDSTSNLTAGKIQLWGTK